jgi:allantoin racemase
MIRILYQFATAKHLTDLGRAEVERRRRYLQDRAAPDVEVAVATPAAGPGSIECDYDAALAIPELLKTVEAAEAEGFHAVIISCFSDPGLEAARELVSIPVVGSSLCGMHAAAMLAPRFSVLSPRSGGARSRELARRHGLEGFFASSRGIGLSVMELARDRETCLRQAEAAARLAVEEDGAEALVLGCMSMAFHSVAEDLQDRLGIPVVNPAPVSLGMAETLGRAGLSHSKRTYPAPPKREWLS